MKNNINKICLNLYPYVNADRIIKTEGNYIPQFCLHISDFNSLHASCLLGDKTVHDRTYDLSNIIENAIYRLIDKNNYNTTNIGVSSIVKERIIEIFNEYLNTHYLMFPNIGSYTSVRNMTSLNVAFSINKHFRTSRYLVNKGCVRILINNYDSQIAACLVVKRKYIELYKLYYLAGIEPFAEMFEFWIDLDLIKNTVGRIAFLSKHIDNFREDGILIRNISDIDNKLCNLFKTPEFNSPEDKFNFNSSILDNFKNEIIGDSGLFNTNKYERLYSNS